MTEVNEIYELLRPIKGWPVNGARNLKEATEMIFGSPYWEMPEDRYIVIDKNDVYSLLAVYSETKPIQQIEYLAVNINLMENTRRIT